MKDFNTGSMNWDASIEMILDSFVQDFSEILEGTDFYVVRNSKQDCVNLMKTGVKNRVGHIWPKKKSQSIDFCLKIDLMRIIESKIDHPESTEVKKDRMPNWRGYPKISYEKAIEIITTLAGK